MAVLDPRALPFEVGAEHDFAERCTPGRLETRGFRGGRPPPRDRLNQGFVIEDHEP